MSRVVHAVSVFESEEAYSVRIESYDGRECIFTLEGNSEDNVFCHYPLTAQRLRNIATVLGRAADEMDKAAATE